MDDPRGSFKANSADIARAVKELPREPTPRPPADNSNDQKSCKKFSQIAAPAQKLDGLQSKHTFHRSKK
jgi:hypothetical protein